MKNFSQVLSFNLTGYVDTGPLKYMYFMIIMCLYVTIVASNVLLMVVICVNRSLHEPMYVFLCSLFVNELLGSSAVFPFLILQILRDVHFVSAPFCFLQIYTGHTYACVEFFMLAIMAYDRYLAICCPLHYNQRMASHRVVLLVALSWFYPFILVVILISLSAPLHLCGNVIDKVYCDNYSIVKLACSDTTVNNIYGLIMTAVVTILPISFIVYTYMRILKVCFSGSKQTRHKALTTCTPHMASVVNFCFGACFEVLQSRFNMDNVPHMLRIFLSIYWLTCQPIFNPLMYGLNMSKIRIICKNLFLVRII